MITYGEFKNVSVPMSGGNLPETIIATIEARIKSAESILLDHGYVFILEGAEAAREKFPQLYCADEGDQ